MNRSARTNPEEKRREYPLSALHLDCDAFELGDAPADAEKVPVQMLIRTNEGVERFGEVWYHDFAGMRRKERVSIDYLHQPEQVIGYLDAFDVKPEGLVASGYLVPYGEDDVTRQIIHRARAGVPYEASIYFGGNGMRIEEVTANAKTEVNGQQVNGPAVVFREWALRSAAIVPWGADGQTRTKMKLAAGEENIAVRLTVIEEEPMSLDAQTKEKRSLLEKLAGLLGLNDGVDGPAEDGPEPAGQEAPKAQDEPGADHGAAAEEETDESRAQEAPPRNPGQRFLDTFGEQGALWFAEGITFEEAEKRYLAAIKAENEELKQRLSLVDRGEKEPAEFRSDGEQVTANREELQNYGDKLSALVAFNADRMRRK